MPAIGACGRLTEGRESLRRLLDLDRFRGHRSGRPTATCHEELSQGTQRAGRAEERGAPGRAAGAGGVTRNRESERLRIEWRSKFPIARHSTSLASRGCQSHHLSATPRPASDPQNYNRGLNARLERTICADADRPARPRRADVLAAPTRQRRSGLPRRSAGQINGRRRGRHQDPVRTIHAAEWPHCDPLSRSHDADGGGQRLVSRRIEERSPRA